MTASPAGILPSQSSAQPQPVDYSLPGVMRYLQTEWQRNERDRIQWNLERAEMKTRIAKLEGDKRSLELVIDGHLKKIAILEAALDQQQRTSGTTRNEPGESDSNNTTSSNDNKNKNDGNSNSSFTSGSSDRAREAQMERDFKVKCVEAEIDLTPIIESRIYLEKCIQEVDYLLQSSHISSNGGANDSGSVDDEDEEEEVDVDDEHQRLQHHQQNSHAVNSGLVNNVSHAAQQQGHGDANHHDVDDTLSTTSTITN
jgi:striatin 1/3/4